jgi:sterol desaturase/sphingolipid hydroxylase (fatty acid hydroxylase superfamily)
MNRTKIKARAPIKNNGPKKETGKNNGGKNVAGGRPPFFRHPLALLLGAFMFLIGLIFGVHYYAAPAAVKTARAQVRAACDRAAEAEARFASVDVRRYQILYARDEVSRHYLPTLVTACGLILLLTLETWLPAAGNRRSRLRHAARNLTLGLLNAVAVALLAAPLIASVSGRAEESRFGLLNLLSLPPAISAVTAFLLFDGWLYLLHRANHKFGFLWRFHRVHHSDPEMDATTAIRFHTGEVLISSALRLAVIPLLGITLWQLLVYESLMMPVIMFHHSNVNFPENLDRWLRVLIASPAMHRVHHSRARVETDSNYAIIFSFWDRLWGTLRLRRDGRPVHFGLDEYDADEWQRVRGLLTTPFQTITLRGGD